MPRYEYDDGAVSKYWEITLEGSAFTTRWAERGGFSGEKTKEFKSPAEAQKAYDKIILEKVKEGYEELTAPSTALSTEQVLEKAILENPDDLAAHAAYADYLSQQALQRIQENDLECVAGSANSLHQGLLSSGRINSTRTFF